MTEKSTPMEMTLGWRPGPNTVYTHEAMEQLKAGLQEQGFEVTDDGEGGLRIRGRVTLSAPLEPDGRIPLIPVRNEVA